MTTRVGSFAQSQLIQKLLLDRQSQLGRTQEQVSSGYKSSTFKGLSREAPTLLATKSLLNEIQRYRDENSVLKQRLAQYDTSLTGFRSSVEGLKQEIFSTIGRREASNLIQQVEGAFDQARALLNTQIDGKFIYGGIRDNASPTDFATLDDLLALPTAAAGFVNSQIPHTLTIDQGFDMTYGILADDLGTGFFESLREIRRFQTGILDAGAGAPSVNGTLLAGATSVVLDGSAGLLSGDVLAGDTITFAGDTTHTVYTITAAATAVGNAITLTISPPLQEAVLDNTQASFGGPFSGELTIQQRQFLEARLNDLANALSSIDNIQAGNGIRQRQVVDTLSRLEERSNVLRTLESDLAEVDLAEAISRLNQDQLALEASLNVTSQVTRLNLLDYIR